MIKNIKDGFLRQIKNPALYLAVAIGVIPGAISGGGIGALSGAYIAPIFGFFAGCKDHKFGIDTDLIVGGLSGLMIGMVLGGGLTGILALIKISKKRIEVLSQDNFLSILLPVLRISVEVSIGMAIGAVIGSLKLLGIGTVLGALTGTFIILLRVWMTRDKA